MTDYISYLDIPRHWGLRRGDAVLLSSYISRILLNCKEHGERFNPNLFFDSILDVIGEEGTLLIPTYSWDFCHQTAFDYKKTKSQVGVLGDQALRNPKFQRTRHPLYSFAVAGKDQQLLCDMNNVSSFGSDSPFAYLERVHAKQVMMDVEYDQLWGFTYVHYVEEKVVDKIPYRFLKTFEAPYIDENGETTIRHYSMLVRNLDMEVVNELPPMAEALVMKGILKSNLINGINYGVVDLNASTEVIMQDILENKSRLFTRYKGQ